MMGRSCPDCGYSYSQCKCVEVPDMPNFSGIEEKLDEIIRLLKEVLKKND